MRLLFPSWAFFDAAAEPPTLEVRRDRVSDGTSTWRRALDAPKRRWWHLLFNPGGTKSLAEQTLVERLYVESHVDGTSVPSVAERTNAPTPLAGEYRATELLVRHLAQSLDASSPVPVAYRIV